MTSRFFRIVCFFVLFQIWQTNLATIYSLHISLIMWLYISLHLRMRTQFWPMPKFAVNSIHFIKIVWIQIPRAFVAYISLASL